MLQSYHSYASKIDRVEKSIKLSESIDVHDVGDIELGRHKLVNLVTMCVDIRSSTMRSAKDSIENSVRMLNIFFPTVARVLADSQAIIDKYPGDGVMAHYVLEQNGATRAIKASCMIRRLVDEAINPRLIDNSLGRISCGISIDAPGSETALACVGVEEHMEIIAVGNSVNIAAKMEKHAKDNVIIGRDVYKCLPSDIQAVCTRGDSFDFQYSSSGDPYPIYKVDWKALA